MPEVLTISDARRQFGDTQALDGATLALRRGEWLALLGPNGAGKTTLVRAIAGRVRLDAGDMTLLGAQLDGSAPAEAVRTRLGVVPQDVALYPMLTARENLRAFGSLSGVGASDLRDRVDWALDWTGLADRADDRTRGFSGGMKRRLNIACSVLHRPDVILLDEPTVGVDPQSRQRIWEMLDQLRRDGASLLLTTHQLDEAQQVCDRIVIIDHGRVIASGTFQELLTQTIGTKRRVVVHVDGESREALRESALEIGEDKTIRRGVENMATELPAMLSGIEAAGLQILDLHVEAPTLQAVFIHLTGRELRE